MYVLSFPPVASHSGSQGELLGTSKLSPAFSVFRDFASPAFHGGKEFGKSRLFKACSTLLYNITGRGWLKGADRS